MGIDEAPFIDSSNAPEYFAHGLHDVEVTGSVCRFVFYKMRRTADGTYVREAEVAVIMPCEAVPAGIMLTLQRLGAPKDASALKDAAKTMVTELMH